MGPRGRGWTPSISPPKGVSEPPHRPPTAAMGSAPTREQRSTILACWTAPRGVLLYMGLESRPRRRGDRDLYRGKGGLERPPNKFMYPKSISGHLDKFHFDFLMSNLLMCEGGWVRRRSPGSHSPPPR